MSQKTAEKIMKGIPITPKGKTKHGSGLPKIRNFMKDINGKMEIQSQENVGTCVSLSIPITETPPWFSSKITIKRNATIVVVDDDVSIHEIWKEQLSNKHLNVKYFTNGKSAIDFIKVFKNHSNSPDDLFLITDYQLRGQEYNGIDVIDLSDMRDQCLLVTGEHVANISNFSDKQHIKLFLKSARIKNIKIVIEDNDKF